MLVCGEGSNESIKKGKFVTKIFFSDVEWSPKYFWKMISADVKSYKNNKIWKIWWLYLTNSFKKYLQNLVKYIVKRVCIFHLIWVGILSILIFSIKNRGIGGFLLNKQNLLCVTSQHSLNPKNQVLHKSKPVSSNNPINTNHRKISLVGTDHFNSKLFSLRKNKHSVF